MTTSTQFIAEPDAVMLDLHGGTGARVLRDPLTRTGLFAAVDVAGFRSVLSSGVAARQ